MLYRFCIRAFLGLLAILLMATTALASDQSGAFCHVTKVSKIKYDTSGIRISLSDATPHYIRRSALKKGALLKRAVRDKLGRLKFRLKIAPRRHRSLSFENLASELKTDDFIKVGHFRVSCGAKSFRVEILLFLADEQATEQATATEEPTLTPDILPPTPEVAPTDTATATPEVVTTETATEIPTIESSPTVEVTYTASPTPTISPSPIFTIAPSSIEPACSSATERESSLPAFPGAEGFGTTTVGGSGRNLLRPCSRIFRVTSLADKGNGTLRECLEAAGPRTCVFEVSGVIWANKELRITNPFITVAGQTAPAPGIIIRGSGLSIEASDVVVRHIIMRVGDDPRASCCKANSCSAIQAQFCTQDPGSRDGIKTWSTKDPISNVVIDHVSVAWALDEGMSIVPDQGDVQNITISNSIIASGLDMSIHPEASDPKDPGHSKAFLINGSKEVKHFSFVKNLLAHNAERNIRSSTPLSMEYVNNIVYDWGRGRGSGREIELYNSRRALHSLDLIGNLYLPGPDTFCPETQYRPDLCFENNDGVDSAQERTAMHYVLRVGAGLNGGLNGDSRYFLADNFGPTRLNALQDEWSVVDRSFFENSSSNSLIYPQERSSQPVASSGTVRSLPATSALQYVLSNAGAFPARRDPIDVNTISDVQNRTGRIINCVAPDGSVRCSKNAGGWPLYDSVHRPLQLPQDPMGDDDGDGYTNLDEWLFSFE